MRASIRLACIFSMIFGAAIASHAKNRDRDSRGVPKTSASAPPPEERIDINHASLAELLKVSSLTQSCAGRIILFRPYHAKNDLLQRFVVSDAVYDRIKDYVIAHRDKQ